VFALEPLIPTGVSPWQTGLCCFSIVVTSTETDNNFKEGGFILFHGFRVSAHSPWLH
jgi:hypothetical protein